MDNFVDTASVVTSFRYAIPFINGSVEKSQDWCSNVLPSLDEDRFRQMMRVNWNQFNIILDLIKDDPVFTEKQFPVHIQLKIVLYRLGCYGEGASIAKIANFFGIGDGGTIENITKRVFTAISNLKSKFLFWPDEKERKEIVANTYIELPYCIGYLDGSEIKLAEKPAVDPESYFSRKQQYSIKIQAVCDYELKVRHVVIGYPGSVHDGRIFNNSTLKKKKTELFSGMEWLAADSAYKLSTTVITPYRSNSKAVPTSQRNDFNKKFSKFRVRIENFFSLLKERFNSLKELKLRLHNDESLAFACTWISVCCILNNIIITYSKDENGNDEAINCDEEHNSDEEDSSVDICGRDTETEAGEQKRRAILEIVLNS